MLVGKLKRGAHIVDVLVDNIKMDLKSTVCAKVFYWRHLTEGRVQSCECSDEYTDFIQFNVVAS
jgi:hypothetical protein